MSSVVSRRQWRATPLYSEALQDVDDQLLLITGGRGPVIQFLSIERSGRLFRSRDEDTVLAVERHLRAALTRTRTGALAVIQTAPAPLRTHFFPRPALVRPAVSMDALTPRQREVSTLVAEGLTDAQIGHRLGITDRAVSKHVQRIYRTIGVSGRLAALHTVAPPERGFYPGLCAWPMIRGRTIGGMPCQAA